MKERKMKTTLDKTITIRLNADLLKILKDNNINISAVCRNSLESIADQLMEDKSSVKMPKIKVLKLQ